MIRKKSPAGNNRTDKDAFNLDAMSQTELLHEVETLMAAPAETMDTDRLERYLTALQERAPVMEEFDPETRWAELLDSHPLLFTKESAPESVKPRPARSRTARVLRWVTAGLAAMLALIVTASAFGATPIQSILDWADDILRVYTNPSGVMELPEQSPSEYHSLEEALERNEVDSSACPTWIPRDYQLTDVSAEHFGDMTRYLAHYDSDRGDLVVFIRQVKDMTLSFTAEKEPGGYIYPSNGVEYYVVTNTENNKAWWQHEACYYMISGNILEEELITMIDSIS